MKRHLVALAAAWLATRAAMLWLLTHSASPLLGGGGVGREVWHLYAHWYGVLARGAFPTGDTLWQYPPGAGPVLLLPALLPGLSYFRAFVALTLLADAVTAVALARAGLRPARSLGGAAVWTCGLPLLLQLPLARYDVQVTALAVLALLALSSWSPLLSRALRSTRFSRFSLRGSARACGTLAALGALVKVWPLLVLVGTPRGRTTRTAWTWAGGTAAAVLVLLAALFRHPLSFLAQQGGRGVQIESLGGTALGLARHAGWPGGVRYQYGAMEFTGPHVAAVAHVSLALSAVAGALLLLWRVRARHWTEATPPDAALTAVLLFTVTSRVISPQYMVWLVGLAAVCLTSRQTTQRPVVALVLTATAVSSVVYPALYREVEASTATGCGLMVLRNGLLAVAAVLSLVRLWRASRTAAPYGGGLPRDSATLRALTALRPAARETLDAR
ncbi:glycosyltransferase 87 family protein [Streptomyces sp. NPDC090306]|uniref:glycosyltransferase 87 family protein n=1 Tax=Streptomyces sp. NPDC090306 TaxID=3365961 RepID=UPI0038104522